MCFAQTVEFVRVNNFFIFYIILLIIIRDEIGLFLFFSFSAFINIGETALTMA